MMARPRIRDVIVPGSIRTETTTWTSTRMTVQCGRCGHLQDANADGHTVTCRRCGRTCRLDQAIKPGGNVVALRRRA